VTRPALEALRAGGVTRLSLGVQSLQDDVLQRLGRMHSADRARRAVADVRAAGFDNVSLDLMMWLPGQSLENWLADVDALVELAPDHVSMYLLEIYPNAPLRDEMARQGWTAAPDDVAADMYLLGVERCEAAGYCQYEISNLARAGRFAWHNVKYWTDGEWLGLGAGAHGTRHGTRWRNLPGTRDYVARMRESGTARAEERSLTKDQALGEALMMGLRLTAGIDVAALDRRYGCDIMTLFGDALGPFADAGLIVHEAGRLRLTRDGMLLANEVLAVFV
jgi:oxygen-independent coproporphyrinogen-3 oxidase